MNKEYFDGSLEFLCAGNVIQPLGKRVILRAIIPGTQKSILVKNMAEAGKLDSSKASYHEVTAIGKEVTKVEVGDMCLHISTASDAADFDEWEKKNSKYLFCHEDDIVGKWSNSRALEFAKEAKL